MAGNVVELDGNGVGAAGSRGHSGFGCALKEYYVAELQDVSATGKAKPEWGEDGMTAAQAASVNDRKDGRWVRAGLQKSAEKRRC